MPGEWKEVLRLSFKGKRFQDHALDLTALTELSRFQKLIVKTAKALWHAAHPSRERLPAHFEARTRLCLRQIEDGSAIAPLEVYLDESETPELFPPEPCDDLTGAVHLACRVLTAAEDDVELPDEFPRELLADYSKWGESLAEDESIEFRPSGQSRGAKVTRASRERLASRAESPYEDTVDVTGEVTEADVRAKRFQVVLESGNTVSVAFSEQQESDVTTALKDHRSVRVQVCGRGEFLPGGRLQRISKVEKLQLVHPNKAEFDHSSRSIEDEIADIAAEVPDEAWQALPNDLTDQLDHHLYGTPKQ